MGSCDAIGGAAGIEAGAGATSGGSTSGGADGGAGGSLDSCAQTSAESASDSDDGGAVTSVVDGGADASGPDASDADTMGADTVGADGGGRSRPVFEDGTNIGTTGVSDSGRGTTGRSMRIVSGAEGVAVVGAAIVIGLGSTSVGTIAEDGGASRSNTGGAAGNIACVVAGASVGLACERRRTSDSALVSSSELSTSVRSTDSAEESMPVLARIPASFLDTT